MRSRRYADEEEQTGANSGRADFQLGFLYLCRVLCCSSPVAQCFCLIFSIFLPDRGNDCKYIFLYININLHNN